MRVIFSDNSILPARLVGADAEEDIAVLKVEAEGLKPQNSAIPTSCAAAIWWSPSGDPLGYRTSHYAGNRIRPKSDGGGGWDSDGSDPDQRSYQFGNSGGALINDRGQVVGITTIKIVSDDGTVEGLGFAIPMARVKLVADRLIAGRPAAMLGITVLTQPGRIRWIESLSG